MLVPVMGIRDLGAVRCDGNGIPPIRTQRMHGVNKILENLCIFAKKKIKKSKNRLGSGFGKYVEVSIRIRISSM